MPIDIATLKLAFLFLIAAILYSSVGHGGASGYIAAMALLDVAPSTMKPLALSLNIIVASIALWRFARNGAFAWQLLWPIAITSIPMAFLGGMLTLPTVLYKPLTGFTLLCAAGWMFMHAVQQPTTVRASPRNLLMLAGAVIGLLSGLTGVGGGIFLSPLLLICRWAETRTVSGVSAAFILLNSIAGLAGMIHAGHSLPQNIGIYVVVVTIGALLGSWLGSTRLGIPVLRRLLGVVLAIAGMKMILAL